MQKSGKADDKDTKLFVLPEVLDDRIAQKDVKAAKNGLADDDRDDEFNVAHLGSPCDIANQIGRHKGEKCPEPDEHHSERML